MAKLVYETTSPLAHCSDGVAAMLAVNPIHLGSEAVAFKLYTRLSSRPSRTDVSCAPGYHALHACAAAVALSFFELYKYRSGLK